MRPTFTPSSPVRWAPALVLVAIGMMYAWIACTAESELGAVQAKDAYYNLMVQGWLNGQTSLSMEAPEGLKKLPDPYDYKANAPYRGAMYYGPRVHDLSYFNGKLYAYFSPLPAVVAFLPFHLLTGQWLSHQQACLLFCLVGLAGAAGTVWSLHARFFKQTGPVTLAVGLFALGFLLLSPLLLQRPDVWEVPIACAHAGWMLTLWFVWLGLIRPETEWKWSLAAGTCAAVAIGSRPATILCGVILLVPIVRGLRVRGGAGWLGKFPLVAAVGLPLGVVGGSLLAFNYARFGNILEFGQKYQLNAEPAHAGSASLFRAAYVPYNLGLYATEFRGWVSHFPFLKDGMQFPPRPPGHGGGDSPFGLLTNLPAIFFSLGLIYAWRGLPRPQRGLVFLSAGLIAALALACALPLLMFPGACLRYEFEFAAYGALLVALGYFAIEGFAPGGQRVVLRAAWYVALAASVAFCLLFTAVLRAQSLTTHGIVDLKRHNFPSAIEHLQGAARLNPGSASLRNALGTAHFSNHEFSAAARDLEQAIAIDPNAAVLYANYGYCLVKSGRADDAIKALDRALALQPDFPLASSLLDQARTLKARGTP